MTVLKLLFEDDHIVAVNKPAGHLVIKDRFGREPRENIVLEYLGDFLRDRGHQPDESGRDLYPVHRLDRDTSGLVLFAKHAAAHKALSTLFSSRNIAKTYWAFVWGEPLWDKCEIDVPLKRAEGKRGRGRAIVHLRGGSPARTELSVLQRHKGKSWLEVRPVTGRLHQIRVHLRVLGVPVLNDPLYGLEGRESSAKEFSGRMPLHARTIEFIHPFTEKPVSIEAGLDEEMRTLVTEFKTNRKPRKARKRRRI